MTCTLDAILPNQIDARWEEARLLLEKASERCGGRYDAEDLRVKIRQGEYQLWLMVDGEIAIAALVTQIINWPQLRECRMIIMVGEGVEKWLGLLPRIEWYAKKMGCAKMSGVARLGWEKMLTEYRKSHVFLEKDL